jgi:hypothetical protein
MALSFQIEKKSDHILLQLTGAIDEQAEFEKITLPETKQLVIDLKNIKTLNSIGLRDWSRWMSELTAITGGIVFKNCPNIFVHQMNILDGFINANTTVESIIVPFYCESCNHHENYLAVRGTDYFEATADKPEKIMMSFEKICEKCGKVSEADILKQKHFKFLKLR